MKTLVYLGSNQGDSLNYLLRFNFDKILCVDADPSALNNLKNRYKNVSNLIAINTCLTSDINKKEVNFYFNKNRATNSILKSNCLENEKIETIKTSYLPEILKFYNIENISLYVSDLQGSDLEILKTIEDFIQNEKIEEIFIETYNDLNPFYVDPNNHIKDYINLLGEKYKIDYMSGDSRLLSDKEQLEFINSVSHGEVDVHWSLKKNNYIYRIF